VNFPANDFDLYYPRLADALRRAKAIVIYCDGIECGATEKLAGLLEKKGFGNLYLFVEGWPAWEQAGYPKAVGAKPNGD
jgi:rhodanese-related sulfurtransferase